MSNPLRWGILGTGNIAKQFAAGVLTAERSTLAAVGSRTGDSANAFAAAHKIGRAHATYDALIADPGIDAVYISMPNSLHHEWTTKALRAGKHVLCEKPFAMDLGQSVEMFDAAERQGRVLIEAFMYRAHPLTQAVHAALKSGAIGELKSIRTSFCYKTSRPTGNVRFDRPLGGGALMDVGCYCLNFARHFSGEEPSMMSATAHFHSTDVDDVTAGVLAFPSGVVATFITGMSLQADNTATLAGSEGYIEVPIPWKPPVKAATYVIARGTPPRMDSAGKPVAAGAAARETRTVDAGQELYALEADAFARCVLDGAPPFVTRADTLGNMKTLDELRRQIGLSWSGAD